MGKKVVFHPYARYKMNKRGISESQVLETMLNPDSLEEGKFGRNIAQKKHRRYLLRVVFERYEDHDLIITAYPARPERYSKGR